MTVLPATARKLIALGILALFLALPLAAFMMLLAAYQQNRQDIADQTRQLAKLEAIARYAPELARSPDQPAEAIFAGWFLPAANPGMAAASLQERLRALAQGRGVDIMQAADVPPKTEEDVVYAGVSLDMVGQADGIDGLLADIEQAEPLLIVSRLALRPEGSGGDPRYDAIPLYLSADIRAALPSTGSAP